jgi:hypothetical protein
MANTIHIVVRAGFVEEVWADCDVDVIVYDLDTDDSDMRAEVEKAIVNLPTIAHEVEIF